MNKASRIYVAGHRGLVGSAILRRLRAEGFNEIIVRTHDELDLTMQRDVERFFEQARPEYVFLAAAKVGGIFANNTYPADFIYQNLMIQNNVIHSSYLYGVTKLVFLGSSCIYPRLCPQPMKTEHLLTGPLEPTNEPYAVAKIAGIKMCQSYNRQYETSYISLIPANVYGENDNFDPDTSHVLPALIRKFHAAKVNGQPVVLWGTGSPRREFLHVDDLAGAVLFLMINYHGNEMINIGTGHDMTIAEIAETVRKVVGFAGEIIWDPSKPDGMPRKLLDSDKLGEMGWKSAVGLSEGVRKTYEWFIGNVLGNEDIRIPDKKGSIS